MLQIQAFPPREPVVKHWPAQHWDKVFLPDNCKQRNFNHRPKANTGLDTAGKNLAEQTDQPRQLEDDDKASGAGRHSEQAPHPRWPDGLQALGLIPLKGRDSALGACSAPQDTQPRAACSSPSALVTRGERSPDDH